MTGTKKYLPISEPDYQNYLKLITERNPLEDINAMLLAALKVATHELNAIRARDGAPQFIEWDSGQPTQISSCTDEFWDGLTQTCLDAIALAEPENEDTP